MQICMYNMYVCMYGCLIMIANFGEPVVMHETFPFLMNFMADDEIYDDYWLSCEWENGGLNKVRI